MFREDFSACSSSRRSVLRRSTTIRPYRALANLRSTLNATSVESSSMSQPIPPASSRVNLEQRRRKGFLGRTSGARPDEPRGIW